MTVFLQLHWPELLLCAVACLLFLLGASKSPAVRRFVPAIATGALLAVVAGIIWFKYSPPAEVPAGESSFALYIKLLAAAIAILFVLLAWPTNAAYTGNVALDVGHEVGEFFALLLLAVSGIFLVASADDLILLFLGIELASIPTYIMVSISRPLPVAQEAGVKYFFLGAMAAALMLFGFSYLYGTTGSTSLTVIRQNFNPGLGGGETERAHQEAAAEIRKDADKAADAKRTVSSEAHPDAKAVELATQDLTKSAQRIQDLANTISQHNELGSGNPLVRKAALAALHDGKDAEDAAKKANTDDPAMEVSKAAQELDEAAQAAKGESPWQLLAIVMVLMGFAFKLAAVPLHSYAGDVYQGAATPVTALLAFVPKTAGIVAVIKILSVIGGPTWAAPGVLVKLLWAVAVLTMTFGNVLGLMQQNIKRIFAYSSVAHSGYMLVALTALMGGAGVHTGPNEQTFQSQAITAVLFYLCAYGVMNTGAFGILMLLPGRTDTHGRHDAKGEPLPTASSAETLDDIAGKGRRHIGLGLGMAICCFSLTGLPLTIGFFGKVMLISPAFKIAEGNGPLGSMMAWLVVLTMINAAISAAYYLKIVVYLFLRAEHGEGPVPVPYSYPKPLHFSWPVAMAVVLSVVGTLFYGIVLPGTRQLTDGARTAADSITEKPAPTTVIVPSKVTQVIASRTAAH